jgi:hypothetical protein
MDVSAVTEPPDSLMVKFHELFADSNVSAAVGTLAAFPPANVVVGLPRSEIFVASLPPHPTIKGSV